MRAVLAGSAFLLTAAAIVLVWLLWPAPEVRVGSKSFTEPVILGEMIRMLAEDAGVTAGHSMRMGDTSKTWNGLRSGALNVYVEYTGTLFKELFAGRDLTLEQLKEELASDGILMSRPLGFSNNYALGMKEEKAAELKIRTISDLRGHPDLRLGVSHAFLERGDGWHGLKTYYKLPFATPPGMEHTLSYKGLGTSLDVMDVFTTDAEIKAFGVRVLEDDGKFFPKYEAVLLYRADLARKHPEAVRAILKLEGKIDNETMIALNSRVNTDREAEAAVAAAFLEERLGVRVKAAHETAWHRLWRMTWEHLLLVVGSLVPAIAVAVPLGVVAARRPLLGQLILGLVSVVQTFPALALLSVLILLMRSVGTGPAVVALFVYSLLPIVRNTVTGLQDIPLPIRESAEALGLSAWDRLTLIEMPMAARSILAGVKTAAVINVGFATLGGLVAAGGYGSAIIAGLDKNDAGLLLLGAVPAVIMALVVQGLFDVAERFVVSRGLRLKPAA
jgi:osmoprotectant transport system permease protein